MPRQHAGFALAVATAVVLAGCLGGSTPETGPSGGAAADDDGMGDADPSAHAVGGPGEVVDIGMTDTLKFAPGDIVVKKGSVVRWTNTGASQSHDVTHDAEPPAFKSYGESWEAGNLAPGDTYEFTFDTPGTFAYFCKWHGKGAMSGSLTVVG